MCQSRKTRKNLSALLLFKKIKTAQKFIRHVLWCAIEVVHSAEVYTRIRYSKCPSCGMGVRELGSGSAARMRRKEKQRVRCQCSTQDCRSLSLALHFHLAALFVFSCGLAPVALSVFNRTSFTLFFWLSSHASACSIFGAPWAFLAMCVMYWCEKTLRVRHYDVNGHCFSMQLSKLISALNLIARFH